VVRESLSWITAPWSRSRSPSAAQPAHAPSSYRLAIFDFDGTLADSAEWTLGVFDQIARRYGFRRVSQQELQTLRGLDNRAIVRFLGVPAWKMPLIARHMRGLMARDAGRIALFAGVEDLLQGLAGRGVTIAIVSSNSEENVRRILGEENAGLVSHYACGASIFGKARKFRRVLKLSGVAPEDAIGIGDEVRDIEAAAQAGMASGAVTWGYATPELLREHRPTLLFDFPADIVERIG
jgi:phosphoglycolate phosphatase